MSLIPEKMWVGTGFQDALAAVQGQKVTNVLTDILQTKKVFKCFELRK